MSEPGGTEVNEFEGQMGELKAKWQQLDQPVRLGIVVAAVVVGLIVIVKILPALIAAMGIGLLLAILFVPYWIPTIVAFVRKQPNRIAILVLNFFFGWTFIGWVGSLVWALSNGSSGTGQHTVIVNTTVGHAGAGVGTPAPPQYKIGDIVNGHRFDGVTWVPLPAAGAPPAAVPPPPPPPAVGPGEVGA